MRKRCTVCNHPDADHIDQRLLEGAMYREIARSYDLSEDAVGRHANRHLSAKCAELKRIADEQGKEYDFRPLDQLMKLHERTNSILETEDGGLFLRAVREARENIKLIAELMGTGDTNTAHMDIHLYPDWIKIRELIVTTLEEYPLAQQAIVRALSEHGY